MKPPFAYYGGKTTIADRIVELLPEHRHYVEPFAGSLAVLLAKAPAPFETVNDLDRSIVTFWRVLRDRPEDLTRVCALTPHSRHEHQAAYDLNHPDEVEIARRVWVCLTQGRGGSLRRTGWRHFQDPGARGLASMPNYLAAYVERMRSAAGRLADVSLECRDALTVVREYGRHEDVLIYADPPYLGEARSSRQYRIEMSDAAEHQELLDELLACRSAVVLSGYATPMYDDALADWRRVEIEAFTGQGNHVTGTSGKRTEVLWINRPADVHLFSEEAS